MNDSTVLKPCPFCGSTNVRICYATKQNKNGYTSNIYYRSSPARVECGSCHISTPIFTRACRAVKAWNRRTSDETVR